MSGIILGGYTLNRLGLFGKNIMILKDDKHKKHIDIKKSQLLLMDTYSYWIDEKYRYYNSRDGTEGTYEKDYKHYNCMGCSIAPLVIEHHDDKGIKTEYK